MKRLAAILLLLLVSGCTSEKMGASEYGVVFKKLPRFMSGGMSERILKPGEIEFVFLWEDLYRFDTSIQSISWGDVGEGSNVKVEDYVETRSLDGNEVGLAVTIHYHLDPQKIAHVLQNVGENNQAVARLVDSVARADIRTHMNILKTQGFFNASARQEAVSKVKESLARRLEPEGVVIDSVIYNDHRFERRLPDGTYDRKYQELIDETQATNQKTQQEEKRIATVIEQKRREFNETQALVNRLVKEAEGFRDQAKLRGDGYFEAKTNEAEQVRSVGLAEVEGLKEQIAALSGPGGKALLRLQLVKELLRSNPRFVLVNSSEGGKGNDLGFNLNRVDTNQLLEQTGIFAGAAVAGEVVKEDKRLVVEKPASKN